MVTIEDIIELGFMPQGALRESKSTFYASGKDNNKNFIELKIIANFDTLEFMLSLQTKKEKKIIYEKKWTGFISSVDELEDKLQELNGED